MERVLCLRPPCPLSPKEQEEWACPLHQQLPARVGASLLLSSQQRIWAIQRNTKLSGPGFLGKPRGPWADCSNSPSRRVITSPRLSPPSPTQPTPLQQHALAPLVPTPSLFFSPVFQANVTMVPCAGRWAHPQPGRRCASLQVGPPPKRSKPRGRQRLAGKAASGVLNPDPRPWCHRHPPPPIPTLQ